jgi:superfamily II DNA or RNA helicase|nr:hypothetical protein [Moraxella sp. CTOTU48841]
MGGIKGKTLSKQNLENADVIIATGKFISEGFDLPSLDTLFITLPISWKGIATQYLGRIERNFNGKKLLQVYDYVDITHPVLNKMYQRRATAYKKLGYLNNIKM